MRIPIYTLVMHERHKETRAPTGREIIVWGRGTFAEQPYITTDHADAMKYWADMQETYPHETYELLTSLITLPVVETVAPFAVVDEE